MEEYSVFKVTIRRQIFTLSQFLIKWALIGPIFAYYWVPSYNWLFLGGILFFAIMDIPTPIIHVQYYLANKKAVLKIDRVSRTLYYLLPGGKFQYHFDDITSFQQIESYGAGAWYTFGDYRYFKILFKDKREIVVTCLMVNRFLLPLLLGIKPERKARWFAFINAENRRQMKMLR